MHDYKTLTGLMAFGKDLIHELERGGHHELVGKMGHVLTSDFETETQRMERYRQVLRVVKREAKDLGGDWRREIRRALRQINRAINGLEYRSKKYFCHDVIYIHWKKHACPQCGETLSTMRVSRIVHSKSEEAKDFDFGFVDYDLKGNVEFFWDEFICESCGLRLTVKELKGIEQGDKGS